MQQNLPRRIQKPRSQTQNQNTNHKNVPKRQRHPRHLTSTKHKPKHHPISFKKTKKQIVNINPKYLDLKQTLKIRLQMDEMWSRVYCKETPCWLWHAVNHEKRAMLLHMYWVRVSMKHWGSFWIYWICQMWKLLRFIVMIIMPITI